MSKTMLIGLLLIGLTAAAHALPPQTWVLTIGNDVGDGDEVELLYAEADAQRVAEVLRSHGGVASTRVTRLLGEDPETIVAAVRRISAEIGQAQGASALVVYYSGHADAQALHLGGERLRFDTLRAVVEQAPASIRVLLVDACRSGGVSRVKGFSKAPEFKVEVRDHTAAEGMAIITSSAASENSMESDRLGGSVFTHHLLNGLRGAADRNGDGKITLSEAYEHTFSETVRSSGRTLNLQHPTYSWDVKGRGEVVLTRTASQKNAGRLRLGESFVYLITEAQAGTLVAELKPPRAGAELSLPPKRYRVQERRPRAYINYDVALRPGQTVALAKLPAREIRYDRLVRKGGGEQALVHGLFALAGSHGALIDGEDPLLNLVLGYTLDTRWFSLMLRGRLGTGSASAEEGRAARDHQVIGAGLGVQRAVDFEAVTVGLGVIGEAVWHRQVFESTAIDARQSVSGGFGVLLAVERALFGGVGLRIEGGPTAWIVHRATADAGAEGDAEASAEITWWLAGGATWRF